MIQLIFFRNRSLINMWQTVNDILKDYAKLGKDRK